MQAYCTRKCIYLYKADYIKREANLSLCLIKNHAMKPHDSGDRAPCINLGFKPRPLYPQGKSLWFPLDRRSGMPHPWPERGGEEKNPYLCRESNPSRPTLGFSFRATFLLLGNSSSDSAWLFRNLLPPLSRRRVGQHSSNSMYKNFKPSTSGLAQR
jgi:hypothetical protein